MPQIEEVPHEDSANIEDEMDSAAALIKDHAQAVITSSDWTLETVLSQMRKGNIDLSPRFQRREAWTAPRKSRLIESIILNFPIPQVVLAERHDRPNTYIVLDGKQRLLAIRQFCVDKSRPEDRSFEQLRLEGLRVRTDLIGSSYEELQASPGGQATIDAVDNHTLRTVIIRQWPSPDYLHQVFLRLNTGSVQLSAQELRQALHPGPFIDFVDEFASSSVELHRAMGVTGTDFRMRDNEVFLRYLAFATRASEYSGNLKSFLDDTAEYFNKHWQSQQDELSAEIARCKQAIDATVTIFGERESFSSFRDGQFEARFNRAVFDIMTYYFRVTKVRSRALENRNSVKDAFVALSTDSEDFVRALTTTTKSKVATATRFVLWADTLEAVLDSSVSPPGNHRDWLV